MNPESKKNPKEDKLTPEQESGLKYFERVKKMENMAVQLREILAPMSEAYPDIDPEKQRELDKIFSRIFDTWRNKSHPNIDQLLLPETADIYAEEISNKLGLDLNIFNKLFARFFAELKLRLLLQNFESKAFSELTIDDMHEILFYNQIGEKLPGNKMNFDAWMKINGVPSMFSGNLIISKKLWDKRINSSDRTLGEIISDGDAIDGCYYRPDDIDSHNPFEVLGLSVLVAEHGDKAEMMLTALHESSHQIDLYSYKRVGDDKIINEIIAFRSRVWLDSLSTEKIEKFDLGDLLKMLYKNYFEVVENQSVEELKSRMVKIRKAVEAFGMLEQEFDAAIVQHILLNCLTLDDLIAWSFNINNEEEIEKYNKWKEDRIVK